MPVSRTASEERAAKFALMSIFVTIFVAFAAQLGRRHRRELELRPLDLGLLSVATYRLGRLAAYDKVFEPYWSMGCISSPALRASSGLSWARSASASGSMR
ncbi:MAG TPA: hypothetical protein VJG32_10260 [Anaerolineae bacterium]|nr:hypothetical protein [Anaerolineae bacterium]